MTTKKRKPQNRMALTISDELKAALNELNDATGVAAASFVTEIMEGNIPMILGIAQAARLVYTRKLLPLTNSSTL